MLPSLDGHRPGCCFDVESNHDRCCCLAAWMMSGWYSICMNTQIADPTSEQVAWASETFKLLADPTRLRIVWTLLHGEHSVNSLANHVGAQPSAVSQHLAKLHLARVVQKRRQGTYFYYSIQNEHLGRLATEALFSADHAVADLPPGHEHRPVAVSTGETA